MTHWTDEEDPGWGAPRTPSTYMSSETSGGLLGVDTSKGHYNARSDPEGHLDTPERPVAALRRSSTPPLHPQREWEPIPDEQAVSFAREVLGLSLWSRQAAIISAIYRDGIRTAVLRLGRRSGKGRIASVVAVYEATVNAAAHLAAVRPGEKVAVVIVAVSQKQARIVHRFISEAFRTPRLRALVQRETADEIELTNGIALLTLPCFAASVRGYAIPVLILDEAAWFQGVDGSPLDVGEIWRALVPATAQFPQRRVLVLSTPRFAGGWFADLCDRAGQHADWRHWHASTSEMNPSIPRSFLDAEQAVDPVAFRREYQAEFEAGIAAALDSALVRSAVVKRGALGAEPGKKYLIALDPAFTGDRFAVIVGHRDGERLVIDRITSWRGSKSNPVQIDRTLDAVADLAAGYNAARVVIDQHAAEPIRQGLVKRGVHTLEAPWSNESKVSALAALRRSLYAGRLELPDHHELIAELLALEQRPLPSGRPRIAAPRSGHDDFATALMALVSELARERRVLRAY